jgi:LSD1 subclass zinc finger protein
MLLTCPNCRSGLQVPDGTAAMVRCPACKTVFSPADSEPDEGEDEGREERPKTRKPRRDDGGEPRKKKAAKARESEEEGGENRDFDPVDEEEDRQRRRKRRRREADEELAPEERAARKAAFARAAVGAKLIWVAFGLFLLSMFCVILFFFQFAVARLIAPSPMYIVAAGVFGLLNWILAAVGVGLCLSGPRAPGHWGYGISAAVAVAAHAAFLLTLVAQAKEVAIGQTGDNQQMTDLVRWGQLPTRMDATMMYLTVICYQDQLAGLPKGAMVLSMVTGLVEMVRTVLIMMLLSCLARAALDEELAHKCTRAGGVASGGPGLLALAMLIFVAAMVETNAAGGLLASILLLVAFMGVYAVLMGTTFPAFMAAREVADACDEPFQSLIPQL